MKKSGDVEKEEERKETYYYDKKAIKLKFIRYLK